MPTCSRYLPSRGERESAATQSLYGLDRPETGDFGRGCLLARRLLERGVRFVQLYHGAGSKWDAHQNIEERLRLRLNDRSLQLRIANSTGSLRLQSVLVEAVPAAGTASRQT